MRFSFLRILSICSVVALSGSALGVYSAGSSLGEYPTVACSTNAAFAANSCNQCFDGGKVKTGERLTGLFDSWTNSTTSDQVLYRDEQMMPTMIQNLGGAGTEWNSTPADSEKIWRYTTEVTWISSSGTGARSQFLLTAGDKVKFLEADIGAGYNLTKTDKKDGEAIGLVRFPIVFRNIDDALNESDKQTHYECVIYKASAPSVVPPTPTTPTPEPPKPTPSQVTTPKTGPESLLLIAAAFFIAFGLMFSLRKNG